MGTTHTTGPLRLYTTVKKLITLWTLRLLKNFSACTVQLYLYFPYGLYILQYLQWRYSTSKLLFPYGPYGLYRISVPVEYIYKSIPTMGPTVYREPQCQKITANLLIALWVYRIYSFMACTIQLYLYIPMGFTSCPKYQSLYSASLSLIPLWAVRAVVYLSICTTPIILYSSYGP